MSKKALLIGIDKYDKVSSLSGCVNDIESLEPLLSRHENGSRNYDCKKVVSTIDRITRAKVRELWSELFEDFAGDVLFYFSGHGAITDTGGFIVTQDAEKNDIGLAMNELLDVANKSKAQSVLLMLDCCFSGDLGNPPNLNLKHVANHAQIKEGLTIIAASRGTQVAVEIGGRGVFTQLVIGALNGGASDVRGHVSAASIYAYVEQALGSWDQRPIYKSHADRLPAVRYCEPCVSDNLLRELPKMFPSSDYVFQMNPSFEHTHQSAVPEKIAIFDKFKILRNARLLNTEGKMDLYYVALRSMGVMLTPLGKFYRELAQTSKI